MVFKRIGSTVLPNGNEKIIIIVKTGNTWYSMDLFSSLSLLPLRRNTFQKYAANAKLFFLFKPSTQPSSLPTRRLLKDFTYYFMLNKPLSKPQNRVSQMHQMRSAWNIKRCLRYLLHSATMVPWRIVMAIHAMFVELQFAEGLGNIFRVMDLPRAFWPFWHIVCKTGNEYCCPFNAVWRQWNCDPVMQFM